MADTPNLHFPIQTYLRSLVTCSVNGQAEFSGRELDWIQYRER